MKAGAIIMRENNQKAKSDTASKNVGSFVKIDSISIDLEDVKDKNCVEKCEHFSIRGYVAEVRTKNWQLCWPFSLGSEQNKSEVQKSLLPPLDSPKFRWWSCQSCLQEIGSRGTAKDYGTEFNSCIGSKASSTCSQICDSVMPFPDAQQTPTPNEVEKRQSDVYISTNANGTVRQLSLCSDKKEASTSEAHTTIIGLGNGSENDAVHEIPRLTFVPPEINSNVLQEKPKHCTEALDLAGSKPKDQCKNSCGKHEVPDSQPATNMGMCNSSSKTCQTEKPNSLDEHQRDLKIAYGASDLACLNEEAGNAVKGQTNGYGSEVSEECDSASSDSIKILVGNTLQAQNHSLSSGSQHWKTRKVRLLTELLLDNGDAKTDHVSAENSPPNAIINNASAGVEMVDVHKDHVSLPENCGEDLDDIQKRKMPQDEEGRSPVMSSLNNRSAKSNNLKGSEEVVNEIAVAELEQDASAGLHLRSSTKSCSSKYGNGNSPITGKKKNKKNQTTDAPSTLVPIGESLPGQIQDQVGSPSKGNVHDSTSSRLVKAASTSRRLDKNPLAASRKEKKSSLLKKKKSKMIPVDDGRRSDFPFLSWPKALSEEETPVDDVQTSEFSFFSVPKTLPKEKTPQFPWNSDFQKKDTAMRNEEIMQPGPVKVSFAQAEHAPVGTGLHLSLGSYFPINEFSNNEIPRTNVDANYKCDSSLYSKPASYAFFNKQVHGEFSRNLDANNMPIQSGEQKNSQVEEGCYPLVKQVDISGARNCDQAIKGKEHSSVSRKNADRIAANVSDPGAWDDIPMEIVELMARNQYERRLENAENNKRLLKMANEGRSNQSIDYDRVYGSGELRINEDSSQRRNPRGRNGKNGINPARKGVQSAKQKAVDYISNIKADNFDINHLGQKSSSGVQIPVHSSKCSCAQDCNWNRDMLGHEFLNAGMQIEPCEKCPTVSQPREAAAHLWPSTLPLRMPPRYNIPPMVASQPTNLDFLRKHDPRFLNLNVIGHEKHNQNSGSETFSRRSAEYPSANKHNGMEPQQNLMGSLDLYSNETIPAMHLLSLMDAGMQSGPSLNTGGNSKFLKRVGPVDHNSKEYSRPEFGVYGKPSDSMKHPLVVYSKPSDTMNHPLNYYAKNKLPEKSHDFFPLNPMVGPSTSSFHRDKGFERANDFMGQVSSSSRKKEKVQTSSFLAQNRGCRPPNSMFASASLGTNHNVIPAHGLQKGSFGASASMVLPLQLHTAENSPKSRLEAPHNNGTFWPPKISPESTICSINRNPADFSMPEAGNEYMIRGEDLKFRKLRKRPYLLSVDHRKRQKNIKRSAEKANAQH